VRIRIDRRDTLADGSTAVIDYKTGEQVSTADWFKERLRDVQVPLYAAHAAEPVAAAVLARVGAGAAGYLGVWQTPGAFPPRSRKLPGERSWPAQLATWRRQVGELVAEYAAGDLRLLTGDADLDEARGAYAPLTRVLEQVALARGALQPWQ
jgi:RecB family exonuclease